MVFKLKIPKFSKINQQTPAQVMPFKEFNHYIKMSDNTYRCILKITPINHELLEDDENEDIAELMREAINAASGNLSQITVSSERINLDDYEKFMRVKYENTEEEYFLERLDAMRKYIKDTKTRQRTTKTFYFTIASRYTDEDRAAEEFEEVTRRIDEALGSADISCTVMNKYDCMHMLYDKMNPKTSALQPFHREMDTFSAIAPVPIDHQQEDYSIIDGMYYKFYTITNYPMQVTTSWMNKLFSINAEVDVSIIMNPTGKGKVIKTIDDTIGHYAYQRNKPGTKASVVNELQKKEDSALELIDQLSSDSENMFNVTVVCAVREHSLKNLEIASERLTTAISSSRMSARQLILMNNEAFWLSLPVAYRSSYLKNDNMTWPMPTSSIASILPFSSSDFMMTKGVVKGKNPSTNSLVIVDRRDKVKVDNSNECVIAPSGRGKTWYSWMDISRENALGTKLFVIDPEREYKFKFGERIIFSLGSKFTTNPFHIRSAILDNDEDDETAYIENVGMYLQRKIGDLLPFFKYVYKDMGSTEEAEVTHAMEITYREYAGLTFESDTLPEVFPTLSDFYEVCARDQFKDTLDIFRKNLRPYVEGIFKNMFNGQTNWSLESMLTVLDIHSLSDVIQPQMMYLLLQDLWEYIKIDRNELKGFYVDEAWKLASPDNPQTLKFLFQLAKRIRKYGGYLTTITQNVSDFFGAKEGSMSYGQAIFDNSFFKLILGLSTKDYQTLIESGFTFSRKEERILKRRKSKGRGIYMIGTSTRVELQTVPLVDEIRFMDPAEFKRIQSLNPETEYSSGLGAS